MNQNAINTIQLKSGEPAFEKYFYRHLLDVLESGLAILEIQWDCLKKPIDCKFLEINHSFETIIGQSNDTIKGKPISRTLPQAASEWLDKLCDFVVTGKHSSFEFYAREQSSYYEVTSRLIDQDTILVVFTNITRRKKIEKDLLKSKEDAEKADKQKSVFLANMSHEIRTPMNSIIGFSDLLMNPALSEEDKDRYLSYINSSGSTLLNLIDDIIDISKIEAGQINLHKTDCDLNNLFYELYVFYEEEKTRQDKREIDFRFDKEKEEHNITIHTDPNRLRQILSNLIGNALKFTKTGFIEFGCDHKDTQTLLFFVKDTGIGISEDHRKTIFDRFEQIEHKDNTKYKGTGLGLTISKGLVQLLGGKIWVESESGVGSTFYFTLPLKKVKTKDIGAKQTMAPNTDKYDWKDKTILVVEDEETNFIFFEEALRKTNAKLLRANSGEKAIDICNKKNVDMVLMDIKMPELDGYATTKKIKALKKNIPVIAQTAYAIEGEKERSFKAGCDDYIAKPIRPKELLGMINKYFVDPSSN